VARTLHLRAREDGAVEHVDVVIIGAGLSGIGAACQLRARRPGTRFAVLEAREAIGGTWDLFRYPGVRSDSDMVTLGYSFRPWTQPTTLADGASIRDYVRETAREHDVESAVRLGHRVVRASWSSAEARWTVEAMRTGPAAEASGEAGTTVTLTCRFLYSCTGYYRYDRGYVPDLPGVEHFGGHVVHPQAWPEDLDVSGTRVVVIGSGATAVTLVPALAQTAGHVTMLQRSPSWVLSTPGRDRVGERLRRLLPSRAAFELLRWRNVVMGSALYRLSRRAPRLVGRWLRRQVAAQLPEGYDVATHFTPTYDPWDQRLCLVPDGDLFAAIRSGRASVVTDRVDTFTEAGLRLVSGQELDADVVVTATGLDLLPFGGTALCVDGADVDLPGTVAYQGMMISRVPNFAFALGYTNASWTLRADLVSERVCRLLNHLDERGYAVAVPGPPPTQGLRPIIDFSSGYVARGVGAFPRQGPTGPWRLRQDYVHDVLHLGRGAVEEEGLRFLRAPVRSPAGVGLTS
jgi:monooxygenase